MRTDELDPGDLGRELEPYDQAMRIPADLETRPLGIQRRGRWKGGDDIGHHAPVCMARRAVPLTQLVPRFRVAHRISEKSRASDDVHDQNIRLPNLGSNPKMGNRVLRGRDGVRF